MSVILNKTVLFQFENESVSNIHQNIEKILTLSRDAFYLEQSGRKLSLQNSSINPELDVKIILRLNGGKGGFGSMLRAIGAQIEKTTNREACRDLSGRRLRDINEEQRLKNWIATKEEREKEAEERKKKKLAKLTWQPKHEFKDEEYDKDRTELTGKVEDAVLQGLQASQASCSTKSSVKRPNEGDEKLKIKKRKLWVDAELEDLSCSDEDSEEESVEKNLSTQTKSIVTV